MATGASNTLTKELRIELKFVTSGFANQAKIATDALDRINNKFKGVQKQARITGSAFTGVAKEAKKLGNREVSSSVNQNAKALRSVSASAKSATRDLNKYSTAVAKSSSRSLTASRNTKSFSNNVARMDASSKSATGSIIGLNGALGAFVTISSAKAALNNALAFDRVENRMKAATNSTEEFNDKTEKAAKLANRLGVDLLSASRGFATLTAATRGSGVEGAITDQLFESILKTSAALSLTADETNSVILAFGQVASKGRAAAEEIRGQIGERIPGFYTKLAEALGKTQAELTKLLDQGLLSSDEALTASAIALDKAFGDKALDNAQSLTAEVNRLTNNLRELGNELTRVFLDLPNPLRGFAQVNDQIQGFRESRSIGFDGVEQRIKFLAQSAKTANEEFLKGNITLDQRNKRLQRSTELIKEEAKANIGRFGGVRILQTEQKALTQIAIERGKSLEQLKQTRDLSLQASKAEQQRLENTKKIRKERERERQEFIKQVNLEFDLNKAKKQREELELLLKLQKARDEAIQKAKQQQASDPNSEENLNKRLKALKEQKKLIDASRQSVESANQVSFIGSFTNGFDQSENIRKNILARSRQLGATKGDVELAKRQAEASERTADAIERVENKLEVINV
jgi:tape measure domain-containing protein